MNGKNGRNLSFIVLSFFCFQAAHASDEAFFQLFDSAEEDPVQATPASPLPFRLDSSKNEAKTWTPIAFVRSEQDFEVRNGSASNIKRLQRAELISLSAQILGMGALQAADAWHTGRRPFSDTSDNLRRAWTTAPAWDQDSYFYNYIGHPYTGAFTYNLMRSQNASPVVSWLFSCSQSLIWEFTLEATEQQPSVQDLLFTSNIGSLMGEAFHRLTNKMRENGLSWKEKLLILVVNPAHLLNNGFR